jgi:hypothetical protein
VLVYRGITFWLAIVIGWTLYLLLRRDHPPAPSPGPAEPGPAGPGG